MDAGPDQWGQSLESFLDQFAIKLVELNDSSSTEVPDQDAQTWLIHALHNHEGVMGMVAHMQQLDLHNKCLNLGHKTMYKDWVDGRRFFSTMG
jgi:hypothetical protein